ncbi:MAG: hypothetical protein ACM3VS_16100 [Candidatus Dadabacteria bacterium]
MERKERKEPADQPGQHEHILPGQMSSSERNKNASALSEAEKDMNDDAELTSHHPNDDLDEGESARLGEDIPGLI